jgi:hypothetical protein
MTVRMKSIVFRVVKSCSSETAPRFTGKHYLHLQGQRVWERNKPAAALPPASATIISFLLYSSSLKTEAICSLETSVDSQRTTRRYIPGDSTLRHIFGFLVTMQDN